MEVDLHSEYGIDVDDEPLLSRRSWRWLKLRIVGLCSSDTRLARALAPKTEVSAPSRPRGRYR